MKNSPIMIRGEGLLEHGTRSVSLQVASELVHTPSEYTQHRLAQADRSCIHAGNELLEIHRAFSATSPSTIPGTNIYSCHGKPNTILFVRTTLSRCFIASWTRCPEKRSGTTGVKYFYKEIWNCDIFKHPLLLRMLSRRDETSRAGQKINQRRNYSYPNHGRSRIVPHKLRIGPKPEELSSLQSQQRPLIYYIIRRRFRPATFKRTHSRIIHAPSRQRTRLTCHFNTVKPPLPNKTSSIESLASVGTVDGWRPKLFSRSSTKNLRTLFR